MTGGISLDPGFATIAGAVIAAILAMAVGVSGVAGVVLAIIAGGAIGLAASFATPANKVSERARHPVVPLAPSRPTVPQRRNDEFASAFLAQALEEGSIDQATYDRLLASLGNWIAAGTKQAPAPVEPTPTPRAAPAMQSPPPIVTAGVRKRSPQRQAAASLGGVASATTPNRFAELREAIVSDVTVNGLAYLGVFLVFAGTLGFLLFSFGSLTPAARPLAELAIPTVLLGSAAFLRLRGAPVVATALGLVGGVLLPIVLFASFVDGAAFPPDVDGAALGWAVVVTSLVLAAAYATAGTLIRGASVRYLVAPMIWTAAWGVGIVVAPGDGADPLRSWTPEGFALVGVAVAATAIAVRLRPTARFAADARAALIPGGLVALGATVALTGGGSDDAWWPLFVVGLASLVTSEAVAPSLRDDRIVQGVQPVLLWITLIGVQLRFDASLTGPLLVGTSIALLEWQVRRRPAPVAATMNGLGAAAGVFLALSVVQTDPWSTVAAFGMVALWAHARRIVSLPGFERDDAAPVLDPIAVVAPAGLVAGLVAALPDAPVFVATGVALALVAVVVRLARKDDSFASWGVFGSAIALGGFAAAWIELARGPAAVTIVVATVAVALVAVPIAPRVWGVVGGAMTALAVGAVALDVSAVDSAAVIALLGAAVVLAVSWQRGVVWTHLSGASWVAATAGAATAVGLDDGWRLVAILGAWTVASAAVAVAFELRETGAAVLVRRVGAVGVSEDAAHVIPAALVLTGLAGTVTVAWMASGERPARFVLALSVLAVLEAAATWLLRSRRLPALTVGFGGIALAAAMVAVAGLRPWLSVWTLVAFVLAVVFLEPKVRKEPIVWVAWAAAAVLVVRLVDALDAGPGWGAAAYALLAIVAAVRALHYGNDRAEVMVTHQAVAAALVGASLFELRTFADWSDVAFANAFLAVAVVTAVAGFALNSIRPRSPLVAQSSLLLGSSLVFGTFLALLALPSRQPLVVALLIGAGVAGAIGTLLRRTPVQMLAPPLAAAASIVWAGDLVTTSALWWSLPVGLALLAIAALGRLDRRRKGESVHDISLASLEIAGMGSLLVPALVEIVTLGLIRGVIPIAIGVALAVWGLATRVRRRLFAGVLGVVVAAGLMLLGPIARLVPAFEGPVLWVVLALAGVVLITIATSLERGRARVSHALRWIDEILGGWE